MKNFKILYFFAVLLATCFVSCHNGKPEHKTAATPLKSSVKPMLAVNKIDTGTIDEQTIDSAENFATYYVVIADTGLNYNRLRTKMFELSDKSKFEIDTMGRHFDPKQNLIALPKNDDDELYAGEYFPRRSLGETLSLEYLEVYKPTKNEKQIALVTGIFESENEAEYALSKLKNNYPNAFKTKSSLYIGCMH